MGTTPSIHMHMNTIFVLADFCSPAVDAVMLDAFQVVSCSPFFQYVEDFTSQSPLNLVCYVFLLVRES
jgi:hypothetical protein